MRILSAALRLLGNSKGLLLMGVAALLPLATFAQSDVVAAPEEFNPAKWDWNFILYLLAAILLILVIARVFDINKLAEKSSNNKVLHWNNIHAGIAFIVYVLGMIGVWYEMKYHGKHVLNTNAATEHGSKIDSMFNLTFGFTFAVFLITQSLLFYFMIRYRYRQGKKAAYYFHNNTLELIWTTVPAIVLTVLVLKGFNTWSNITGNIPKDATQIEIVAQQFQWKARYAGDDNALGKAHFTFIDGKNEMGLAVGNYVDSLTISLNKELAGYKTQLDTMDKTVAVLEKKYNTLKANRDMRGYPKEFKELGSALCDAKNGALKAKLEGNIRRVTTTLDRISKYRADKTVFNGQANDDIVTSEIYLVKGKPYKFNFRSKDALHSAWIPEFRVQMNCVPGMPTYFAFVPTKTTAEARAEKGNEKFDYYLYCNKICGGGHSGMKIKVVVVGSESELQNWLADQPTVTGPSKNQVLKEKSAPKTTADSASTKSLAVK